MIRIQERDRRILRACYEQRFLTMDHIIQEFYRGRHQSEAYRRIKELETEKYIRREMPYLGDHKRFIRLTERGLDIAMQASHWEIPKGDRLNPNFIEHDSLVTFVRFRLEQYWDGEWVPRTVLESGQLEFASKREACDGAWCFPSGKWVAVELECIARRSANYAALIDRWANQSDLPALVLFVCAHSAVHERVKEALERSHSARRMVFASVLFKDFQTDPDAKAWTIRGDVTLFNRRTVG